MSDSNSGDTGGSPYGPPPSQNPYGQPPTGPPANPYGEQPVQQSPYGDGPPQQQNPYGDRPPQQQNPYGQTAQQPPPYGPQQPAYAGPSRPYGGPASDNRPGSVTGAAVLTLIFSGLTLLFDAFLLIALVVERAEFLDWITRRPWFEDSGISAESAFGATVVLGCVVLVWCLVAVILAVLVLRRSNAARITLVVSAAVTALLSLLSIDILVPAATLLAAVAVIVLLFVGGANEWFKGKNRRSVPGMAQY
jgi:hypothetical protein